MNEERIELPGGGVAYVSTLLTHEQENVLYRHWLKLDRFQTSTIIKGTDERRTSERADLSPEELEQYLDLQLATRELHIRTCTRRWDGVTDPEGTPLSFPEDVGRMRSDDFDELFRAVGAARHGSALPNSTRPSSRGSTRASGRKTP